MSRISLLIESLQRLNAPWGLEPGFPLTRPPGTLFPTGGEGWGEGVRSITCALCVCALLRVSALAAADAPAISTNASPARTKDNIEFTIGPVYANAPELTVKDGVPRGTLHEFTMNSEDSKIYPGIARRQPGT